MDKKGFLLGEETLKIIIALICLGLLVYFLGALYMSNLNSQKLVQAEETLSRISDIVKNNQANLESVEMLNPAGWYLFSFVNVLSPNSCAGKNCLCICDNVNVDTLFGLIESRQLQECGKNGVCLIVENLNSFEKIKIEKSGATSIEIDKTGGVRIRLK